MKLRTIAIALLFPLYAMAQNVSPLKKEFIKRFAIKEGHYNTITTPGQNWDYCQDEELDIDLREMDAELVLTIGPRLVFPELQARQVTSDFGKNCFARTTNTIVNHSLEQVVTEVCQSKVQSRKTHLLQVNGDVLTYQFTTQGQTQSCKYQLMTPKEASN